MSKGMLSQLTPTARGLENEVVFRSANNICITLTAVATGLCLNGWDVVSTDNPLGTSDCDTNHLETKSFIETHSFADVAGNRA